MKNLNKKQILIVLVSTAIIIVIVGIILGANILKTKILNNNYNSANNGSNNGNLIPEYIKAGISIGGITGTLENLDTSDATATEIDIIYGKTAYVNGEKIEGLFVPRTSLKVGDYVSYSPDTASTYSIASTSSGYKSSQTIEQETLTWKILSINDDGTIDLISSNPINQILYLRGAQGYNNGVYLLNDICAKQYSNKEFGTTARSITKDDIEKKLNETGIKAKDNFYSDGNIKNGDSKTYTVDGQRYYPNLYAYENGSGINTTEVKADGIGRSESYYTKPTTETYSKASKSLTVTQNYYFFVNLNTLNYFDDTDFFELIFGLEQEYWLASRFYICNEFQANFGVCYVSEYDLANYTLFKSDCTYEERGCSIRPVVTLESNIQLYGGDGSVDHPYKLRI